MAKEPIAEITRFKSREEVLVTGTEYANIDGPVSGSIAAFPIRFENVVNSETEYQVIVLPDGAGFRITDIKVFCGTVTSDPQITVGKTAAGTQLVASTTLVTGSQALAIKGLGLDDEGVNTDNRSNVIIGDQEFIDVRIVADAGDAIAEPVSVTVYGYHVVPSDTLAYRA